jgi:hypothetical protein
MPIAVTIRNETGRSQNVFTTSLFTGANSYHSDPTAGLIHEIECILCASVDLNALLSEVFDVCLAE